MCFTKYFCCFSKKNKKQTLLKDDFEKYRRASDEFIYDDHYYDVMENWKFFSSSNPSS